jgi:hypothetical protein
MSQSSRHTPASPRGRWLLLAALVFYAVLIGGYWVARYSALWEDVDTGWLTRYIESVRSHATLVPPDRVYHNGMGFQALSVFVLEVTGIPLQALQSTVYPLISLVGLVLMAFAFYSQVTQDRRIAALAVLLLVFQADVLFVTLRGSHEKLDWPLLMMVLMLLWLSFRASSRARAMYVLLFYFGVFAMITSSVFFASSFLAAVCLSLLLGLVVLSLQRRRLVVSARLRRLVLVALSCSILVVLFMFYLYPVSIFYFRVLSSVVERTSILLLGFEPAGQPYARISVSWTRPQVYLGLTLFTWLLVVLSFLEWFRRGWQFLSARRLGLPDDLDWLLYAGFAIQVAMAIVVDFSGALGANLQLRMIPAFTVLAVVVLARGIARIVAMPWFGGWTRRAVLGFGAVTVAWFGVAALLKATNEPLLSHNWTFYARSEEGAIRWVDDHLQSSNVWTGNHPRLAEAFCFLYASGSASHNEYDAVYFWPGTRYVLLSKQELLRATRAKTTLPSVLGWNRVYDNGDVYLYHRRPRTPFQR